MKKDFKYPILSTFFDVDNIPCVFVDEVKKTYPQIEKFDIYYPDSKDQRDFDSFGWDISTKDGKRTEIVMASADAQLFIDVYNRTIERCKKENITIDDIDISMVAVCSVCNELLMPDDECYVDGNTNEPLCDGHSIFDEDKDFYVKSV